MDKAFEALRQFLTHSPLCVLPDGSLPFVLRTDASDAGLGAVLLQDQGSGLQPIAYASKKLSGPERNYAVIEKECLAIVWGIRRFEPYLFGRQFSVQTDHNPLAQLDRISPVNGRLLRWALFLQQYSFRVQTIAGQQNKDADFLSRCVQEEKPAEIFEVEKDLFSLPSDVSLAHCVSADMVMGRGIARQFVERFGRRDELLSQNRKVGQAAVLQDGDRWLYYLVTKARVQERPSYHSLRRAIRFMCGHAVSHGVKHLAVPLLGCGLDGLQWSRVKNLLEGEAFGKLQRVTVCRLPQ